MYKNIKVFFINFYPLSTWRDHCSTSPKNSSPPLTFSPKPVLVLS